MYKLEPVMGLYPGDGKVGLVELSADKRECLVGPELERVWCWALDYGVGAYLNFLKVWCGGAVSPEQAGHLTQTPDVRGGEQMKEEGTAAAEPPEMGKDPCLDQGESWRGGSRIAPP